MLSARNVLKEYRDLGLACYRRSYTLLLSLLLVAQCTKIYPGIVINKTKVDKLFYRIHNAEQLPVFAQLANSTVYKDVVLSAPTIRWLIVLFTRMSCFQHLPSDG